MRKRGIRDKNQQFFHYNFFSKNYKGIITEVLPFLLIALAVLVAIMVSIFIMKGTGTSLIARLKSAFFGVA